MSHCVQRRRMPGSKQGPCCGDRSGDRRGRALKGLVGHESCTLCSQSGLPALLAVLSVSAQGSDPHRHQLVGGTKVGRPDSKAKRALPGAENHMSISAHSGGEHCCCWTGTPGGVAEATRHKFRAIPKVEPWFCFLACVLGKVTDL